MSDDISEEMNEEEALERASDDGIIGRFLADALMAHCDDEHHMTQMLTSIIINMGVNKIICPHCFQDLLNDAIGQVFERVDDAEGNHETSLKMPEEILAKLKEGITSH